VIFEGRKPLNRVSERKHMVSECDQLVRKLVMARDNHRCVRCGKSSGLAAAHVLSKGHYDRIRWELLNVIALCVGCHIFGAHKDPTEFTAWLEEKYPGRSEQLREMAATAGKTDLKLLAIVLRLEVAAL
jgi:5-methylcytosine-specific restriction endonuclease McrA